MQVFLVTSGWGMVDDYRVLGVFSTRAKARAFGDDLYTRDEDPGDIHVEEWEVDEKAVTPVPLLHPIPSKD